MCRTCTAATALLGAGALLLSFSSCETIEPEAGGLADNVSIAPSTQSFIIVDQDTGYIIDQRRGNEKKPIAGLAHIATAMVAIDWMQATGTSSATQATVSPTAAGMNLPNPLGLRPGDSLSLRDYLYAILMNSDATAAYALAEYVGSQMARGYGGPPISGAGGLQVFVQQMNVLAQQKGMTRTRFVNAHGYDGLGEPNTSTASDLARLTQYAVSKPAFQFKVSQPTRPITVNRQGGGPQRYTLRNTNELLGRAGIDGVKTGRSQVAGGCLILGAERPPKTWQQGEVIYRIDRRLIVVALGSINRFQDGMAVVNYGWSAHDQWLAQNRPIAAGRTLSPMAPAAGGGS